MAIANGTCVSFCNQPKAQFSYPRRVTPVYVVAFTRFAGGGIWLPQESLCTIWPGYAPGTIAVNVTWIERGFSACQTHRSMYSSIFNRNYELQRAILVGNCNFFLPLPPRLAFIAPVGGVPVGISGKSLVLIKLESSGYQAVKTV